MKERELRYAINNVAQDEARSNEIFEIVKKQHEY